jgi:hypothetical protein
MMTVAGALAIAAKDENERSLGSRRVQFWTSYLFPVKSPAFPWRLVITLLCWELAESIVKPAGDSEPEGLGTAAGSSGLRFAFGIDLHRGT